MLSPEKRQEIIEATNMVIKLCLIANSKLETAYIVGAEFAKGLEKSWEKVEENNVPTTPSIQ